jgi:predicted deacetylase
MALLVVPNFHGRWPLQEFRSFVDLVNAERERGSDILLHGYAHLARGNGLEPMGLWEKAKSRFLTAGEGEFQSWGCNDALCHIQRGMEILDHCFGFRPEGFVAPAWLEHRDTAAALRKAGLLFHENHLHIEILEPRQRHFIPAIAFSTRTPARLRVSKVFARSVRLAVGGRFPLRLALHPRDFASDDMVRALRYLAVRMGDRREYISYSRYFKTHQV